MTVSIEILATLIQMDKKYSISRLQMNRMINFVANELDDELRKRNTGL